MIRYACIIPCDIDQFFRLRYISITCGTVKYLPEELFNLDLVQLSVHSNELTDIPRKISKLVNLRSLGIMRNRLSNIPKEIFNLTMLNDISLDFNRYMSTHNYKRIDDRLKALLDNGVIN